MPLQTMDRTKETEPKPHRKRSSLTPEKKEAERLRKREVRKLKKEGLWEAPNENRKLTKSHNLKDPFNCECCGIQWYHRYGGKNRFCCQRCAKEYKQNKWLHCSKCHAGIGLGAKSSSKIIQIASSGAVRRAWAKHGIKANLPPNGAYFMTAKKMLSEKIRKPIQERKKYESAWMMHVKSLSHFPDWSICWTKEQARRGMKERYEAMSAEEKRAWNKRCLENRKKQFDKDPEAMRKQKERMAKWKRENGAKYLSDRRAKDPGFRIVCNLRSRMKEVMGSVLNGGSVRKSKLIGCSTKQLAAHLESQFDSRMTWENYGMYWHVDHIIPVALFDQSDAEQRRRCWHWTNLQPLEAKANLEKSDSITQPQMHLAL